jgi:hypothetical protein
MQPTATPVGWPARVTAVWPTTKPLVRSSGRCRLWRDVRTGAEGGVPALSPAQASREFMPHLPDLQGTALHSLGTRAGRSPQQPPALPFLCSEDREVLGYRGLPSREAWGESWPPRFAAARPTHNLTESPSLHLQNGDNNPSSQSRPGSMQVRAEKMLGSGEGAVWGGALAPNAPLDAAFNESWLLPGMFN